MQQTAQRIEDVAANINGQLSQLQSQIEPLASAWQGMAQQAFMQLMERWREDVTKLNQALSSIAEMMGGAAKKYDATEQEQQSSFTNILGALGG